MTTETIETKRIRALTTTATEADLTSGNYFAVDTPDATKKVPANLLPAASSIAPVFSASTAYSAGDVVMYQGKLRRFLADHPAGAWTGSDAVEVDVATLNSEKANLIKTYSELSYTVNSGSFIDVKSYNGASYSQSSARNIVITSGFTPGDTIYVSGLSSASSNYGLVGFFNSSHNSLGYYFESNTEFTRKAFVIPTGTTEIRVNGTTLKTPAIEIISAIKDLSDVDNSVLTMQTEVSSLNSEKANKINEFSKLTYAVNSGSFIDVKSYNGASYSQSSARNIVITSGFTPGDTIYVSGLSSASSNYGLVGFFNSSHNSLGYYFESNTEFTRKAFVIPTGTTEIRVNGTTLKTPAIEIISAIKDLSALDDEQSIERFFSSNAFARIEELQKSCPFSMTINSPVISFVFDDTLEDVKEIADLFETKGLGCCFATVPSRLSDYVLNSNSITRGAALLTAQSDGCEILVHGLNALSSSSTDAQVYDLFVGNKIKLVNYGFSVDGIIELGSGGSEKTFEYARCEKYLKDLYRYSDYYGTGLNLPQYFTNNRVWMTSDLDNNKSEVDSIVSGNSWKLLSAHDVVGGIGLQTLSDTIDYAISEGCEILTMRAVYDKYSNR